MTDKRDRRFRWRYLRWLRVFSGERPRVALAAPDARAAPALSQPERNLRSHAQGHPVNRCSPGAQGLAFETWGWTLNPANGPLMSSEGQSSSSYLAATPSAYSKFSLQVIPCRFSIHHVTAKWKTELPGTQETAVSLPSHCPSHRNGKVRPPYPPPQICGFPQKVCMFFAEVPCPDTIHSSF